MAKTVSLGFGDLSLEAGAHVCALYTNRDQRDAMLVPYLREGLRSGDKCIGLLDSSPSEDVVAACSHDLADGCRPGQLEMVPSTESYVRDDHFSTEQMLLWLREHVEAAVNDGFAVARAAGEMTWALRDLPGVDELWAYESEVNRFAPSLPQVLMCMYDLSRFVGSSVVEMLKTHPYVILDGIVVNNPYYVDPDEFLATRQH